MFDGEGASAGNDTASFCVRKSEAAVANARILDITFRAIGKGAAGYAKPNNAQTAKIKNIPARENSV